MQKQAGHNLELPRNLHAGGRTVLLQELLGAKVDVLDDKVQKLIMREHMIKELGFSGEKTA
jgi:hypothetical protein